LLPHVVWIIHAGRPRLGLGTSEELPSLLTWKVHVFDATIHPHAER
jgi:hypothetical protein